MYVVQCVVILMWNAKATKYKANHFRIIHTDRICVANVYLTFRNSHVRLLPSITIYTLFESYSLSNKKM